MVRHQSAPYHQLGEFISRVESLEEFVKITTIDIDKSSPYSIGLSIGGSGARTSVYKILLSVGLYILAPGVLAS